MKTDPDKIRFTAWIVALIFVGIGVVTSIAMVSLSNLPWTAEDLIFGGTYFIGLLIGRKWALVGGIMSLIMPVITAVSILVAILKASTEPLLVQMMSGSLLFMLILMVPGFLYLFSWHLERKKRKDVGMINH